MYQHVTCVGRIFFKAKVMAWGEGSLKGISLTTNTWGQCSVDGKSWDKSIQVAETSQNKEKNCWLKPRKRAAWMGKSLPLESLRRWTQRKNLWSSRALDVFFLLLFFLYRAFLRRKNNNSELNFSQTSFRRVDGKASWACFYYWNFYLTMAMAEGLRRSLRMERVHVHSE